MTENKIGQAIETETKEEIKTETSAENMTDAELIASLNRVYAPEEIEEAYVEAEKEDEPDPETTKLFASPYTVKDNCLGYRKEVKGGETTVRLCNFVPRIACEILYDDGEEVTREYEVEVIDENGELLPAFRVPASSFGKMDWVSEKLPARCRLDVTGSVEKHIVNAMKGSSAHADQRSIYAHTGWVRQNGELHFLLPGSTFCEVELSGKCANYGMVCEEDPSDLGILTAMMQLEIVPPDVLHPLFALVFLSPLNSFLRKAGHEPKFVFTLIGRTGAKKSTLSALALSFFGVFSESDLPMSFADTPNSILLAASHLDDVLTCVDDSHPSTKQDVTNMNTIAEKLVRGYGDRAQRNRLTSDITLRRTRPPQGNVIMTAEFVPDIGESSLARLFIVELKQDGIDLGVLQEIQDKARDGLLQRCMYAYLVWLRGKFLLTEEKEDAFVEWLRQKFSELRHEWRAKLTSAGITFHDRLPDTLSCLETGYQMLTMLLKEKNALSDEQRREMLAEFDKILLDHARKQSAAVVADKPTHIFLRNLFAMIECGMVTVTDKNDPRPENNLVGYEDDDYYFLLLDRCVGEVKRFCENSNQSFTLSSKALSKQMREEGLLDARGTANTESIHIGTRSVRVCKIRKDEVRKILEGSC
ncbi:MAG: hypothetical protein IKQ92_14230 [Clostridia bacterium]|nr:hypothetical protein [Clostridia bacterium]